MKKSEYPIISFIGATVNYEVNRPRWIPKFIVEKVLNSITGTEINAKDILLAGELQKTTGITAKIGDGKVDITRRQKDANRNRE